MESKKPEINKRKRIKIGSILAILFILLYLPSLFHWIKGDEVKSDIIRIGLIEDSVNADGVIIRDEILLDSKDFSGKYIPVIPEGEKVSAFSRIATISNKESVSLLKELDNLNVKIIKAQNEKINKIDFFSEDMAKVDNEIGQRVQDIITECNSNSFSDISISRSDIDKLIEKKAAIAGSNSNDPYINSLKQQKTTLQARINSNTGNIKSSCSGIVSYVIDGYEQVVTPKKIKDLTPKTINDICAKNENKNTLTNNVEAGKPFVKLIKGIDLYVAVVLEPQKAKLYKTGDTIKIRINDIGEELQAVISNKSVEIEGKYVITVKLSRYNDILSTTRKLNIDLINESEEGLKVPLNSLMNIDSSGKKATIMMIKANCSVKREVEILCKNNEYAIIKTKDGEIKKTVSLYDTYILNPEKIKEGQIIDR